MRIVLSVLFGVAVLVAGLALWYFVSARRTPPPAHLGIRDGRLAPCPDTPNCVSTQSADPSHRMDPIPYRGSRDAARERVLAVLRSMPRVTVETVEDGYIHAVFRSAFFSFPDDVEFQFDDATRTVQFRSASRVGRYDFRVNRRRMEEIQAEVRSEE